MDADIKQCKLLWREASNKVERPGRSKKELSGLSLEAKRVVVKEMNKHYAGGPNDGLPNHM